MRIEADGRVGFDLIDPITHDSYPHTPFYALGRISTGFDEEEVSIIISALVEPDPQLRSLSQREQRAALRKALDERG